MTNFLRYLLLCCSVCLLCGRAKAQESFEGPLVPGFKVIVVTKAEPKARKSCMVVDRTEDIVTCLGRHQKRMAYLRQDIAGIIHDGTHSGPRSRWICLGVGVALVASSFFVPVVAVPTIMKVLGGIAILTAGNPGDDAADSADQVLWRAPDFHNDLPIRR